MRKFDNRMTTTAGLRLMLAASASAAAFALAGVAYAQEDDVERVPDAAEDESDREERDTVVVTGSRIRRDEFSSAAPVQVLDPELSELQGQFDTASLIQSSSVAAGSAQITAALSSNFVTNGGQGAQTISLRGLGAERTLVLLNGRRAGPAGTRGGVSSFDLNVLPQSIIQSVEILKDGASSIYGSDAVAGVVNILTKRSTDGIELDGTWVQPFKDGGEEFRASATWGKEFDRGSLLISGDYYKRKELARGDRSYLQCPEERIFDPNTGQRVDLIDPRTGNPRCEDLPWGHVWIYDYHYYAYAYGYTSNPISNIPPFTGTPASRLGRVRLFQYDYPGDNLGATIPALAPPRDAFDLVVPAGFFPVGYDPASQAVLNENHPFADAATVIPETTRYTAFLSGTLDLSENVEAYGEFIFNRRETYQNGYRQFWTFGFTSDFFGIGNEFSPASGPFLESPTAVTDHSDTSQRVDYYRGVGGVKGEFTQGGLDGWTWDVYTQYSRSKGLYSTDQIFQDSIDYQYDIGFGAGACEGKVTPVSGKNCVTIDWWDPNFLAGEIPQAARDYLFGTETGSTVYTQHYIEAILSGDVVDLPAGALSIAIGGTWRRDKIDDIPGEITRAPDPLNPGEFVNNAWGNTGAGRTTGSSKTKEIFGEMLIPLLRDKPLVKALDVELAGRWTDVSTFGTDETWKLSANWQMTDWIRFRGTLGTSFRAPALFELFLADQTSFLGQRFVDPCIGWGANLANGQISQALADGCAAQGVPPTHTGAGISATIITGGGLGVVDAETSKAKTLGVIITGDSFLPESTSFNLAVDYFDIEINGEIAQLGAGAIVAGCLTSEFFPNDPLCDLFRRVGDVPGAAGNPSNIFDVRDSFINVNSQKNRGIDVTFRIDQELPKDLGTLSLFSQMTWQLKDTIALFSGTETNVNGEEGEPYWVGDFNFIWEKGPWQAFWGIDAIGRTSDVKDFERVAATGICNVQDATHPAPYCVDVVGEHKLYHSVSLSRSFQDDRFKMTVGVANLFDTEPAKVSNSGTNREQISVVGASSFQSQYDYVGRRAFLNVKATF